MKKINNAIKIIAYFYLLLVSKDQNQKEVLIQLFYPSYKASTHTDKMEDFRNKETKIFVYINCNDVARNQVTKYSTCAYPLIFII